MIEILDDILTKINKSQSTSIKQLVPIRHLSCFRMAQLVWWILELCVPAFRTSLSDWFVPLKDISTPIDWKRDKDLLPDGINEDALFMKEEKSISLFGVVTFPTKLLLSQTGLFLKVTYAEYGRPTIKVVYVEEIENDMYSDTNPAQNLYMVFITNLMYAIRKQCATEHPKLFFKILNITNRVNFSACMPQNK